MSLLSPCRSHAARSSIPARSPGPRGFPVSQVWFPTVGGCQSLNVLLPLSISQLTDLCGSDRRDALLCKLAYSMFSQVLGSAWAHLTFNFERLSFSLYPLPAASSLHCSQGVLLQDGRLPGLLQWRRRARKETSLSRGETRPVPMATDACHCGLDSSPSCLALLAVHCLSGFTRTWGQSSSPECATASWA